MAHIPGQRWRTSRDDMKKPPCKALKSQISRQHEQEKEKNGIFVITKKLTVMNNFTFYSPTEFVFGKGSEEKTGELVKTYGGQKVLIVYGKGSAVKSGLLDRVKNSLDKAGLRHTELGGISPNPTDDKVYEGIEICRRETVDFILAVGGVGVISVLSNVAPQMTHDICQLWFDGKTEESLKLQLQAMGLVRALFKECNPIPVKWAMNRLGWNVGSVRLPLVDASPEVQQMLETELKKNGLL